MADDKQAEIKDVVKKLKHNLEGWREVLLPINSVLIWERNYDPGILVGLTTSLFLILWYFDPSVLTTFSILGIISCVVDYLVPTLSASVFDSEKWTGAKERKFEEVCKGVAKMWHQITSFQDAMNNLKESKPKIYFIAILSILIMTAWIGNQVNNLLLTYLIVTVMVLLPGLQRHGILKTYFSGLMRAISQAVGAGTIKQKKH